jgi:Zn-dependent M28 family amino/carboxypeptidase
MVLSLETELQQKRRLAGPKPPFPPLRMQWIVGTPRRASVALTKAAYGALAALADGTEVTLTADPHPAETTSTWNAVGQLAGVSRDRRHEVIVLSAHHDHVGNIPTSKAAAGDTVYNGADDDASGTIAVLELAAALSRRRLNRTVVFATFGSEETGGQGSTYFIESSIIDLKTVVANLQFEMIGRPDPKVPPQTLWLTGYERSTLGEMLARRGARLVADPHPEQSFFTRSDNIRFARRGVVAHTVSSFGLHTDYHEPSDEMDRIDFAHMTTAIQSLVEPIHWLANGTFRPQWKEGMRP